MTCKLIETEQVLFYYMCLSLQIEGSIKWRKYQLHKSPTLLERTKIGLEDFALPPNT